MTTNIQTVGGVVYTDTIEKDELVKSVWTDTNGTGTIERTTDTDGNMTEKGTWTKKGESLSDSSYSYNYDNSGKFTDGTKKQNGVKYTYDKDWVITQTELELPTLTKDTDEFAFKLFGSAYYQDTTWTDESTGNSETNTNYFNTKKELIGSSNSNSNAWTVPSTSQKMVSTNESYTTIDENKNAQWAGSSWKNFDSKGTLDTADDVLRDSGTNFRAQVTMSSEPAGIDLNGDRIIGDSLLSPIKVLVEDGSNSWTDANKNTTNSDYTRYYTIGDQANPQAFLGGTETRDGIITTWDKDWRVVSQKVVVDANLKTISDASYPFDNKATVLKLFANNDDKAIIYFKQTNSWVDAQSGNSGKEISFFDKDGNKLGAENLNINHWTDQGTNQQILSTNLGYNTIDASGNWQWLGSSWKNFDSKGTLDTADDVLRDSGTNFRAQVTMSSEPAGIDLNGDRIIGDSLLSPIKVLVEDGSNSWTDANKNTTNSDYTRYYTIGDQANPQAFLGGTETRDGIITTWDKDWRVVSQKVVVDANLKTISDASYPFDNKATVLKLFANNDDKAIIYFKQTNSWVDAQSGNSGKEISFFDKDGNKLGAENLNINHWTDQGTNQQILSTNLGYNTIDASGNWQWLGSSWKNFDSKGTLDTADDVLRDSGTNFRAQVTMSSEPAGIDLNGDRIIGDSLLSPIKVLVEDGSNSWTDANKNTTNSDYTRYYTIGDQANPQAFLGGTETRDGIITTWDKDWRVVSQKVVVDANLKTISDASYPFDNKATVLKLFANNDDKAIIYFKQTNSWVDAQSGNSGKEISFFDKDGNKLGAENLNINHWTDQGTNQQILSTNLGYNTIDASGNWQWLGSSWKNFDSKGTLDTADDVLRDSGTNFRAQVTMSSEPAGIDLNGDRIIGDSLLSPIKVLVEDGSNSWTDANKNTTNSDYTRYYTIGDQANPQAFLGGTETRDGIITTWDKDWRVVSQKVVVDANLKTISDASYPFDNKATVLKLFANNDDKAIIYFKQTNSWVDAQSGNSGKEISFFDKDGNKLGAENLNINHWTDQGTNQQILSTNLGYNTIDASGNWQWLGSSWKNFDSKGTLDTADDVLRDSGTNFRAQVTMSSEPAGIDLNGDRIIGDSLLSPIKVLVEDGSNSWTDANKNTTNSDYTRYYTIGDQANPQAFLGGTETRDGIITTWDKDWRVVSQKVVVDANLKTISDASYPFDNKATVLKLFANNDDKAIIYFKQTNSWVDAQSGNSGKEISFFDKDGNKLGAENLNINHWTDQGTNQQILSTNLGYNTIDASGNWQWLGSSWKNFDSKGTLDTADDVLRDSGTNFRAQVTMSSEPAGIDLNGDRIIGDSLLSPIKVLVEDGSNSWTDANKNTTNSDYTRYYTIGDQANPQAFLGGTETRDGIITTWDKDWRVVSQKVVVDANLKTISDASYPFDNKATVLKLFANNDDKAIIYFKQTNSWVDAQSGNSGKEISFFDKDGNKLGAENLNINHWTDQGTNQQILSTNLGYNTIDASGNWQWLGSSWKNFDSKGTLDTADDVLRDSGTNFRAQVTMSSEPAGIDLNGDRIIGDSLLSPIKVLVEDGSNSWTDANKNTTNSDYTRYYTIGDQANPQAFLGGTETRDGIITTWDKDWRVVSQKVVVDANLKTISDASYPFDNKATVLKLFANNDDKAIIYFKQTNSWVDAQSGNSGKEISFFDKDGNKLGAENLNINHWTDQGTNQQILSTNLGYNTIDASGNWQWLGSSWKNFDSKGTLDTADDVLRDSGTNFRAQVTMSSEPAGIDLNGDRIIGDSLLSPIKVLVEDGSNSWTDANKNTTNSDYTRYYTIGDQANPQAFLGGTETRDGIITTWDKDWRVVSQKVVVDANLKTISDASYPFDNKATVLKLFANNDDKAIIYFKQTNSWVDAQSGNSGKEISFFDKDGNKLGAENLNINHWTDQGTNQQILSTNLGYNTIDASGNWQWLGSSWKNFDSKGTLDTADDVLRDSGSYTNNRKQVEMKSEPAGIDLNGDRIIGDSLLSPIKVLVEDGSNSWTDANKNTTNSDYTRYYTIGDQANPQAFLGGTETRDGIITTWDKDWRVVSQKVVVDANLKTISDASYPFDNKATVLKLFANNDDKAIIYFKQTNSWVDAQSGNSGKEISFFDKDGNKLGAENLNINHWTDQGTNQQILSTNLGYNTIDASGNWQWLGSSWKNFDSKGTLDTADDVLRDSGTNFRAQVTMSSEPAGIDLNGDRIIGDSLLSPIKVLVQENSNCRIVSLGINEISESIWYYTFDENNTQTYRGVTETRNIDIDTTLLKDGTFDALTSLTAYTVTTSNTFNMGWGTANGVTYISVPQNIDTTYYLDQEKKLAKYDIVTTYGYTEPQSSVTHDIKNIANYNVKSQLINSSNSDTYTNSNGVKIGGNLNEMTYTYNQSGHQSTYTQTNTQFNATGKTTYSNFWTYDSTGHNIGGGNANYDSNGVKTGSSIHTIDATYEFDGRQLTSKQINTQFDALDNKTASSTSESTNTFDSTGHLLTSKQIYTQFDALNNKTGSSTSESTNTFDSTGHLLTSKQTTKSDFGKNNTVERVYTYSDDGNSFTHKDTYTNFDLNGIQLHKSIYEYGSNGIKGGILINHLEIDGIKTTTYDSAGNVLSIIIDTTGLTGILDDATGLTIFNTPLDTDGSSSAYYFETTTHNLVKYSNTTTNYNTDQQGIIHTIKNTDFIDAQERYLNSEYLNTYTDLTAVVHIYQSISLTRIIDSNDNMTVSGEDKQFTNGKLVQTNTWTSTTVNNYDGDTTTGQTETRKNVYSDGQQITQITVFGIDGTSISKTYIGDSANNNIYGSSEADTLIGGLGNDTINGGPGDDLLIGDEGDDSLQALNGNDTLDGGSGVDTLQIFNGYGVTAGATINLSTGNGSSHWDNSYVVFKNIENINGSSYSDTLIGDDANNNIWGGSGDDTVIGGLGNDTLRGSLGNDLVLGENGDDILVSSAPGSDTLDGGDGIDTFSFKLSGSYPLNLTDLTGTNPKISVTGIKGDDTQIIFTNLVNNEKNYLKNIELFDFLDTTTPMTLQELRYYITSSATTSLVDASDTFYLSATTTSATGTIGNDKFNVASGTYAADIINFAAGDKLNFFAGASITVLLDTDQADGIQQISAADPSTGATATITLKGLTSTQDAALFNSASVDSVFGTGTLLINSVSTPTGATVNLTSAAPSTTATAALDTFNIASGTYTATINNFGSGDKLHFFTGASLTVLPDSDQTDGIQQISAADPATGATTTVILTGLTSAQDGGVFNVTSFNTVFGAGSIA